MRQRFLNRLAQRYLVRNSASHPVVASPGADLAHSADWFLEEANVRGTFHLLSGANRRHSLTSYNGNVALDESALPEAGCWVLRPVGDTTSYIVVASAEDPNRALAVATPQAPTGEYGLTLRPAGDRSSMWLLGPDCVADARSIHLRYQAADGIAMLYNEVYPAHDPPGTFLCTSGFGANAQNPAPSGYAGIQRLTDGSRLAIFSVWHRMADEERPVAGALATVVAAHHGAIATAFSGEGSGSSVRLPLNRPADASGPIRLCITAEPLGVDTVLTAYIASGADAWVSLGAIVRSDTGGVTMSHPYAFIEDFARTGNANGVDPAARSPYRLRSARFANPWIAGASKQLMPITRARVTAYSPHPLENLAAATDSDGGFGIRIATGAAQAASEPPIGASFTDSMPNERRIPNLSGVPYR